MAAKPIATAFADSHLQERAWAHRPIFGDSYYSFEQIINYTIEHDLPTIAAGDLIDKQRNISGPIVFLREQLGRLKDPIYYVQGQHEMADKPWMQLGHLSRWIHRELIEIGGINFYGLDYCIAGQLQDRLDEIPDNADVLVAHQVWSDLMGNIGHPQGGMHDVPKVGTVFTGDFHEFVEDRRPRGKDGQEIYLISPGSTCMQSIAEPQDKYFCVFYDDGSMKPIQLKTRQVIDAGVLSTPQDLDKFLETVGVSIEMVWEDATGYDERVRMPLLKVEAAYTLQDAQRRIARVVGDTAHLFFKERPKKREEAIKSGSQEAGEAVTLSSELKPYLLEQHRIDLEPTCRRLLEAQEPKAELRRMREEALSGDKD
jgi:hypothetical protein